MKIKNKIKNSLLIFLARICKSKINNFDPKNPRILIVSTTALGDTLWSTPSIRAIREKYKNAYIGALVSKTAYKVLEKNSNIDRFFILEKISILGFLKLFLILKKESFQAVCLFHSSQRMVLPLCAMLNPEYLIGSEGINKGLDSLFTHLIKTKEIHEIERRFSIAKLLGVDRFDPQMEFFFEPAENFQNFKKPLIILHPGAKDGFRSYPKDSYIQLSKSLQKELNAQVIITGSSHEKDLVNYIASKTNTESFTNLSLKEFATLIQKADILITGDTGPLHLSIALKTKTIALFVPTDPLRFGPYKAQNCLVIKKPPSCSFCLQRACKDPVCFLQIPTEEILEGCKKILK